MYVLKDIMLHMKNPQKTFQGPAHFKVSISFILKLFCFVRRIDVQKVIKYIHILYFIF